MTADVLLYGVDGSPFVRKVQIVCLEKDIPFDMEEINIFDPPEWFLELSPAKRIPVMRDRGVATEGVAGTIADSSAICQYLEKKHPDPVLYPDDAFELGRALWYEEYADTLLAARIGFGFMRTLITPVAMGQPPDLEAARKAYHQQLPPLFTYLDGEIGDKEFLIGDNFSIADIAIVCQLIGLIITRVPFPSKTYPNLARYFENHLDRPSFRDRLEAVKPMMPKEDFAP